ncbi:integrase/recombinase [Salmonella enterica subsp. enterica]|nr:integrase/recombinase [Salmonella enterica subsp. enterica]
MTDVALSLDVSRFLRYLGVERQLSPITLLNYQRQLDAIIALAGEAGLKAGNNVTLRLCAVLRCAVGAKGLALPVWRYVSRHCEAFLTG